MGSITITQAPDAKITRHPDGAIEVWDVPNESAVYDNRPTASEAYRRGPAPAAEAPAAGGGAPSQAKPYASDLAVMFHPELGNLTNTNVETNAVPQSSDEFQFPHSRVVNWVDGAVVTLPFPGGQEKTVVRGAGAGTMRFRFTAPTGLNPAKSGFVTVGEVPGSSLAADIGLWPATMAGALQRIAAAMQIAFQVGGAASDGLSHLEPGGSYDLIVSNPSSAFFLDFASPARY